MAELIDLVASPQALVALGLVVLIFGFCPGFILRQIVRMYPKGHPRRAEIVAELYQLDYVTRPVWVAAQFETALHEGLGLRRTGWKVRKRDTRIRRYLEFGTCMTRADLVAAAVVLGLPDPSQITVVVDTNGFHYRTLDGTRNATIDPRVIRMLALRSDEFWPALHARNLTLSGEEVKEWRERVIAGLRPASRTYLLLEGARALRKNTVGPPQTWSRPENTRSLGGDNS